MSMEFDELTKKVVAGDPDVSSHDEEKAYYSDDGSELIVERKWNFSDGSPSVIEREVRSAKDPSNPGWGRRLADSNPGVWVWAEKDV